MYPLLFGINFHRKKKKDWFSHSSPFPLSFLPPSSSLPPPFLPTSSLSFSLPPFLLSPPSRPPLLLANSSLSEGEVPLSPGDVRWYTVYSTKVAGRGGPHGGQRKTSENYYMAADRFCVVYVCHYYNYTGPMIVLWMLQSWWQLYFMTYVIAQAKLYFSKVSVKFSSCTFHSSSCTGITIMPQLAIDVVIIVSFPGPTQLVWESGNEVTTVVAFTCWLRLRAHAFCHAEYGR